MASLVPFYLVCSVVVYLWSGRSGDVAAIIRVQGDERQKMIDLKATAAAFAVLVFHLGGLVVDLAHDGTGNPWAQIRAVGGASYAVALAVIRHRHRPVAGRMREVPVLPLYRSVASSAAGSTSTIPNG